MLYYALYILYYIFYTLLCILYYMYIIYWGGGVDLSQFLHDLD